jgi:indole-3-glycerol phosphate synthase/phosphoribosylanthranilate isomerase
VCVPGTHRHVTAEQAAPLAGAARRAGILPVAVLRDAPLGVASDLAMLLNLHAVQLHGREDVEYVRSLRRQLHGSCEIWTAASVGRESLGGRSGDRMLFDNGDGGTGKSFDWRVIGGHPVLARSILAGGIGPANARAAAAVGAYAIDVGSAVDTVPGIKSAAKIGALFEALRPPAGEQQRQCA